jgi:hypothetical protein
VKFPLQTLIILFVTSARTSIMENTPVADDTIVDNEPLSYDDTVAYEEQLPPPSDRKPPLLASRIGQTKIYLLPESSVARVGKVRW